MDSSSGGPNPFAEFAFPGAPAPKRQRMESSATTSSSATTVNERVAWPAASVTTKLSSLAPATTSTSAATTASTVTGIPTTQRLAEYRLIASYRDRSRASVDDFHRFLIDLGTGGEPNLGDACHGRFWALVACLLSVQCRDGVALAATRKLLHRCAGQGAAGVMALSNEELDEDVSSLNFCKTKAKNVRAAAAHAVRRGGRVPTSYDELLALEGVGPKIAHLMRSVAYGEADAGIVVDTHVFRVATRLGWVDAAAALSGAEAVRVQLEKWVPADERVAFSLAVVGFGQHARGGKGWGDAFFDHVRRHVHVHGRPEGEDMGEDAVKEAEDAVKDAAREDAAKQDAAEAERLAKSMVARMDVA